MLLDFSCLDGSRASAGINKFAEVLLVYSRDSGSVKAPIAMHPWLGHRHDGVGPRGIVLRLPVRGGTNGSLTVL
jgi:hypothetical protein